MPLIVQTPPALIEPVEVDDYGAPDFYASGWTMVFGPEVITGVSHIDRMERGVIRRQIVCRTHYARTAWMAALNTTLIGVKGGQSH